MRTLTAESLVDHTRPDYSCLGYSCLGSTIVDDGGHIV